MKIDMRNSNGRGGFAIITTSEGVVFEISDYANRLGICAFKDGKRGLRKMRLETDGYRPVKSCHATRLFVCPDVEVARDAKIQRMIARGEDIRNEVKKVRVEVVS